jgi:hypothetical protein
MMNEADLTFKDWKSALIHELGSTGWIDIYRSVEDDGISECYYSALMYEHETEASLKNTDWDLRITHGRPGFIGHYVNDNIENKYYRYGIESGIEPIAVKRGYDGMRPSTWDISQELIQVFDLYFDPSTGSYLKLKHDGSSYTVIKSASDRISIRKKELLEYAAIKQKTVVLFFDHRRFSKKITPSQDSETHSNENYVFSHHIGQYGGITDQYSSFASIIGKKKLDQLNRFDPDSLYRDEDKFKHQEFIIGENEDNSPKVSTCSSTKLSNNFGKNIGAPHYLTPVFFRKDVLDKYHYNPEKYEIDSASVSFTNFWILRIDNELEEYVSAYLGDLGRDLPYSEQTYWKSFNFWPENGKISTTKIKRDFHAVFAVSERPDNLLRHKLTTLYKKSEEILGFRIIRELAPKDQHHFRGLRYAIDNNQSVFDAQILSIAKILIDCLNEKEILKLIALPPEEERPRGIKKLEILFEQRSIEESSKHIAFLKNLYHLRSRGSAHRKGSSYEKDMSKAGVSLDDLQTSLKEIYLSAIAFCDFLIVTLPDLR